MPNKTLTNDDIFKAIKINNDDVKSLLKKYGKLYYNSLDEKSITLEKKSTFKVDGEEISCRKFTLTLDEKQFKSLIETFYNTMSEDDMLIDLTQGNIASIINLYKDAGFFDSTMDLSTITNKDTFKENLKSFKKTLKEELDKINLPSGFKMTLWVDKNNQILDRRFDTEIVSDEDTVITSLELKKWNSKKDNSKNGSLGLLLSSKKADNKLDFNIVSKSALDKSNENRNENITINYALSGSDISASELSFNLNSTKSKDKVTNDSKNDIKFDFTFSQYNTDFNSTGQVLTTGWANKKNKTDGYSSAINLNLNMPGIAKDSLILKANIKQDYTYDIEFKLPEINDSNSINLNKADKSQLDSVIEEIQGSVQEFLMQNLNMFS
jgi:hypothetical protein